MTSFRKYIVLYANWYQLVYSPLIWKYVWHFWDRNQTYLGTLCVKMKFNVCLYINTEVSQGLNWVLFGIKGACDRFYFNEETSRQYFPAKEIPKVISDRKRSKVWRQGLLFTNSDFSFLSMLFTCLIGTTHFFLKQCCFGIELKSPWKA